MKPSVFLLATIMLVSIVSAEWQIETVDNIVCTGWTSLALDVNNNPHISSIEGYQTLVYSFWDNSAWQTDTVADVSGSTYLGFQQTSLVLNSSEAPCITFTVAGFFFADVYYVYWDGATWQNEEVGQGGAYHSLELDSSDYPCFPYVGWWGLEYACWDGSNWQISMVDSLSDAWYITSLELDSSEYPHISYYNDVDGDLKYASWDGIAWQTEVVDSADYVGLWSSLRLDSAGHPHIAYSDSTNRDLKYAHWNGSDWQIETVDSVGAVGQWVSLDLYSTGYPCISYYDDTNEDLKYAYWDGSVWHLETVDSEGSVGQYTSLKLDPTGHAHISYLDDTNYALKYAYQYNTGIEEPGGVEAGYLLPISPNPASGTFAIGFSIPESAEIGLCIYDMSGRLVRQTVSEIYSSGLHQIQYSGLETGVYLYRMLSGDNVQTQRFVVVRD